MHEGAERSVLEFNMHLSHADLTKIGEFQHMPLLGIKSDPRGHRLSTKEDHMSCCEDSFAGGQDCQQAEVCDA